MHKDNNIKREEYESERDYNYALENAFEEKMLNDIIERLNTLNPNDNINAFLDEVNESLSKTNIR